MRTILAISLVLLLASGVGSPARAAGIDLTWSACNTGGGFDALMFDCSNTGFQAQLVGCFQLPTAMDSLIGVDLTLDLQVEAEALPDFWKYDGCNSTGMTLSLALPSVGCAGVPNPWGAGGVDGDATRAYLSGFGGSLSRGRLVASLFRLGDSPVPVPAETNTFAFTILLSTANATEAGGPCVGCATPMVIVWNSAEFHSLSLLEPNITLANAGLAAQCVRTNGALPATCSATPTRRSTWGSIKSLYR